MSQNDADIVAQKKANEEALKSALNQAETLNKSLIIYYSSASATSYATTSNGVRISSTATGSATSTLSQEDADLIANENARNAANQQVLNDLNIINESVVESVSQAVSQAVPQAVSQAVSIAVPQAVSEAVSEAVPEAVSQAVPEAVSQAVIEVNYKAVIADSNYTLPTPLNSSEVIEVLNSNYPSIGLLNSGSVNGSINAYAIHGNYLFIGGNFTTINGTVQNGIAAYDIVNKVLVNTDLFYTHANINYGLSGSCSSLAVDTNNSVLYIGGNFTSFNNNPSSNYIVASLNIPDNYRNWSWNPPILAQTVVPTISGSCNSLLIDNTNNILYVAGNFQSTYILSNSISTSSIVENIVPPNSFEITISNNNIFVGQLVLGQGIPIGSFVSSIIPGSASSFMTIAVYNSIGTVQPGYSVNFYDPITSSQGSSTIIPTQIDIGIPNPAIKIGQFVACDGIPTGTTVTNITGRIITISTTVNITNKVLYFYEYYSDYNFNTINTTSSLGRWNNIGFSDAYSSNIYNCLALDNTNNILYIGGQFSQVQGAGNQNPINQISIAALSLVNISSSLSKYQFIDISNFNQISGLFPLISSVNSIVLDTMNNLLYVAGNITGAGYNLLTGTYNIVNGIAVADTSQFILNNPIITWITPNNLASTPLSTNNIINKLLLDETNNTLFIGSDNTSSLYINGVVNYGLFIYDVDSDSYLLNDLSLNQTSSINTIFSNNNIIYLGGLITSFNSINVGNSFYIDNTKFV